MENKIYYLYQHRDLDGNIFYIGKGTKDKKKANNGYGRAFSKFGRSGKWNEIIQQGYTIEIIEESIDEKYILEKEAFLAKNECPKCINRPNFDRFYDVKVIDFDEEKAELDFLGKRFTLFKHSGDIYSSFGRKLKHFNHGGYLFVNLTSSNICKKFRLHRLIAKVWIPNPNNYPVVNHKDSNRSNFNIENLEWCTYEYNNIDRVNKQWNNVGSNRKILEFDLDGNFKKEWANYKEVCEAKNQPKGAISNACSQNSSILHYIGSLWIYKEDFDKGNTQKLQLGIEKCSKRFEKYEIGFKNISENIVEIDKNGNIINEWKDLKSYVKERNPTPQQVCRLRKTLLNKIPSLFKRRIFILKKNLSDQKYIENCKLVLTYGNGTIITNELIDSVLVYYKKYEGNISKIKKELGICYPTINRILNNQFFY